MRTETNFINWNPEVSFFRPPVTNIVPESSLQLGEIYQIITGESLKEITAKLREIEDTRQKQAFKAANFPYVTFGGSFSKRCEQGLLQPSGLTVFDFDHLEDVELTRQQLLEDECLQTQLLFVSPSGNGLKWVVRNEEPEVSQKEFFLAVSNYLKKNKGLVADASGSDVGRACYLSADRNCVLNPKLQI